MSDNGKGGALYNFDIHKFIDETIEKKDRYVDIFIGEHGVTVSVYPLSNNEELEDKKETPKANGKVYNPDAMYKKYEAVAREVISKRHWIPDNEEIEFLSHYCGSIALFAASDALTEYIGEDRL